MARSSSVFWGAVGVDALVHVGLVLWCAQREDTPRVAFAGGLGDSLGDLLLACAPARVLGVGASWLQGRRARDVAWTSRAAFRNRVWPVKVASFLLWTVSAMLALVKALVRVVDSADAEFEAHIPNVVFGVATVATMVLSVITGYMLRVCIAAWYTECQEARCILRKERRRIPGRGDRQQQQQQQQQYAEAATTPLLAAVGTKRLATSTSDEIARSMTPSAYKERFGKKKLPSGKSLSSSSSSSSSSATVAPSAAVVGGEQAGATENGGGNTENDDENSNNNNGDVSSHDSDDDSSSDEEERLIAAHDLATSAGHMNDNSSNADDIESAEAIRKLRARQLSRSMRAAERGRRVRERRRKTKEDKEQKLDTGASVRQLLSFAAPDWVILLFAFCCLIVAAIAGALVPKYTGEVINHVSSAPPDRDAFKNSVYKLTLAALVYGVFSGMRGATFTVANARMNIRLRRALYRSLLNQDQGFFDSSKVGDLSQRLSSSTSTVADQINLNINVLLRSLAEGGIVLVLMFRLSWRLSLLSFAAIPLMTLISNIYGEYYRKLVNLATDSLADTSGVAEEALASVSTVRDFGARRSERRVYAEELNVFYGLNMKESAAYAGYALTWTAIPALVTALTLWEGGKLVLDRQPGAACGDGGSLCSGDLVSFMLYSQSLSGSIEAVGYIFTGIASALGAADKIFDLLRREPKVRPNGDEGDNDADVPFDEREDDTFKGTIELRNVFFKYPTRQSIPVLNDFSMKVEQGQIVALVGESGGGKSSVIKLILNHYNPDAGQVLVSGRPVGDYAQTLLRRRMSVVNQEPTLFARSVLRNIVYGLEGCADEPTFDDVVRAAKMANAHEFIMKLPKGYSTLLGERGATLSGGQRQRVCIARALVRRPRILLLDESTSALDAESEAKVLEALDNVMKSGTGMSVLCVAHRLSTIKNSDNIIVVSKGVVAEQGTHETLLKLNGKYAELVRRQLQSAAEALKE